MIVGDLNTNLDRISRLNNTGQKKQTRVPEQGMFISENTEISQNQLSAEQLACFQEIMDNSKIEKMITNFGLTRRRKLSNGGRERSRIDFLLTSLLSCGSSYAV